MASMGSKWSRLPSCIPRPLRLTPRLYLPVRKALRFAAVVLFLLCTAETLLSLTVFLGYGGNTYLQLLGWGRNGSLSFVEFQRELASRPRGGPLAEISTDVTSDTDTSFPVTSPMSYQELPPCPRTPPEGRVSVNLKPPPSFRELEELFPMLRAGGSHRPTQCRSSQRLALILPYRDRRVHLKIFLRNIHPFLQKQQLDYTIFLIELKEGVDFNRALLFNIGFREALKVDNFTCFIFHDVDLLPEDERNLYRCTDQPRHMSVAVDKMNYRLPYTQIFGGVTALIPGQFQLVNGFSNVYFGWGGEDDDMFRRIRSRGLNVVRYTSDVARYKSMGHAKADKNPARIKLLQQGPRRFLTDGLNSLNYTRLGFEQKKLYTYVLVTVDQKAVMQMAESKLTKKTTKRKIL